MFHLYKVILFVLVQEVSLKSRVSLVVTNFKLSYMKLPDLLLDKMKRNQ